MIVALGSARASKIMAVRAACARAATVDAAWRGAEVLARAVESGVPAMPLSDTHLMRGARGRAEGVRSLLWDAGKPADLYVGLEGGFHSITYEGRRHTFLRGWAYATDGERGFFGSAPSIEVPGEIVRRVEGQNRELGAVIDEFSGEHDVRSRQGAWGILSRDLLTRSQSFEVALVAAFAPFYNARVFGQTP